MCVCVWVWVWMGGWVCVCGCVSQNLKTDEFPGTRSYFYDCPRRVPYFFRQPVDPRFRFEQFINKLGARRKQSQTGSSRKITDKILAGARSHIGRVSNKIADVRGGICLFMLPAGYRR